VKHLWACGKETAQHFVEYLVLWSTDYSVVLLSIGIVELNVAVLYIVTYDCGLASTYLCFFESVRVKCISVA
jgi:hypothetical protein